MTPSGCKDTQVWVSCRVSSEGQTHWGDKARAFKRRKKVKSNNLGEAWWGMLTHRYDKSRWRIGRKPSLIQIAWTTCTLFNMRNLVPHKAAVYDPVWQLKNSFCGLAGMLIWIQIRQRAPLLPYSSNGSEIAVFWKRTTVFFEKYLIKKGDFHQFSIIPFLEKLIQSSRPAKRQVVKWCFYFLHGCVCNEAKWRCGAAGKLKM